MKRGWLKIFKFRLQKILNYRDDQKKIAEEEMARCLQDLLVIEQELKSLQEKEQELFQFQRVSLQQLDINTLKTIEGYNLKLKKETDQKQEELLSGQERAEEKRRVLVECWQRCKVLEKLKEKKFLDYIAEEEKQEQFVNDEISLTIYNNRLVKGGEQ